MIGAMWPWRNSGGDDVTVVTPLFRYSNYAEAVLWVAIGAYVVFRARRRKGRIAPLDWVLTVALFAFGGSDVVEVHTGAWWRPWWLLVWKGGCLLAVAAVLLTARSRNGGLSSPPES